MSMHLDLAVDDLGTAVAHARDAGAVLAEHQPQEDVRVMLDPAGHPFCLYLDVDGGDVPGDQRPGEHLPGEPRDPVTGRRRRAGW